MKILLRRGTKRIAFIVGSYLVIKVPRISYSHYREAFKCIVQFNFWFARFSLRFAHLQFVTAVNKNLEEYRCYRKTKATFLAPVYFSIGIVNFQSFEKGLMPSIEDSTKLWRQLSEEAEKDFFTIDPHAHFVDNIRKNELGYRFVDYGNSDICAFFRNHQKELEILFAQPDS